jgi:hypothetical protein
MGLRAGDWVEVRSKAEILRTLDASGRLDALPFMPQMFDYCGKHFKVYKRAHKTCDTVNPIASRRIDNTVHLELRCNGKTYGGCQAACLIFWKEAWLKPVNGEASGREARAREATQQEGRAAGVGGTEDMVLRATWAEDPEGPDGKRYFCQATELPKYTKPLSRWDFRQYVEDYTSGNASAWRLLKGLAYVVYYAAARKRPLNRPARWLYDQFQALVGGVQYPQRRGTIPSGELTPTCSLNLQVGELVRVKSYDDILTTLDMNNKNRGMGFDPELVPYCGGIYRVKTQVEQFLDEKTGRLRRLKTPAVILEGVWCQSRYSECRMHCPRSIYAWWREIWLERLDDHAAKGGGKGGVQGPRRLSREEPRDERGASKHSPTARAL